MGDAFTNPDPLPPTPDGWRVAAIEELCARVTSGATPLRSNPNYYAGGTHSWFKTGELKDGALYDAEEKITDAAIQETSAKLFPPGTVLMAMYGDGNTITSLGILRREAASNQACCALIVEPAIADAQFLFYALKYHRREFVHIATGGAQRNLSGALIRRFAINAPPLAEQRAIAGVLGALDDRIEANRRMNATLEALARALFKSWFVDFDPVRAKMEGRPPALAPDLAALFPARLTDSPLGPIPEGWEVKQIGNVVDVVGGNTPSTDAAEYWGGEHAFATPKDLSQLSEPVLLSTERALTSEGLARVSSGLLPGDTVLLSSRAPIGYLAIAKLPVAVNQGFVAMLCRRGLGPHFAYHWAQTAHDEIINRANGSTFLEISKGNFRGIELVVPTKSVSDAFEDIACPIFDRITMSAKQSRTLAQLRDLLLPKLLSGALRVRDAERMIGDAA